MALAALRRRERSVAELTAWLSERFDTAAVEAAIERLRELGELDDARFARLFADDKRELGGWGPERIAAALAERGIERSLIEQVAGGEPHAEQVDRSAALLDRRGEPLEDDRARSRALGYLTRRGFTYEVAYEAIRAQEHRKRGAEEVAK